MAIMSGCLLNPQYYLSDAQTIAGNISFSSPSGTDEIGHSGAGYARITALVGDPEAIMTVLGNMFAHEDGEEFQIWNTNADNSGSEYAPGDTLAFSSDMHLYAQWDKSSPVITAFPMSGVPLSYLACLFGSCIVARTFKTKNMRKAVETSGR